MTPRKQLLTKINKEQKKALNNHQASVPKEQQKWSAEWPYAIGTQRLGGIHVPHHRGNTSFSWFLFRNA